jgi:hypothetical protein
MMENVQLAPLDLRFLNLFLAKSTRLTIAHACICVMRVTLYPQSMKNMKQGRGIVREENLLESVVSLVDRFAGCMRNWSFHALLVVKFHHE